MGRRILLAVLLTSMVGLIGSLVWDYPMFPFFLIGFAASIINFIWSAKYALGAPVPGCPVLSAPRDETSGQGADGGHEQ